MDFEGSHESEEPSIKEIKQAVKNRGYDSANVDCWWDGMFQRWNFSGDLIHNERDMTWAKRIVIIDWLAMSATTARLATNTQKVIYIIIMTLSMEQ